MDLDFKAVKIFHDNNLYNNYGGWQRVVVEEFAPKLLEIIKNARKKKHVIFLSNNGKMTLPLANNVSGYISNFGYKDIKILKMTEELYAVQVTLDFTK
jgi:biopolymer transport protein ExbD